MLLFLFGHIRDFFRKNILGTSGTAAAPAQKEVSVQGSAGGGGRPQPLLLLLLGSRRSGGGCGHSC